MGSMEEEMDFGRQPKSVMITFTGEQVDVIDYRRKIKRYIEGQGDDVDIGEFGKNNLYLKIYPRAVND